MLQTKPNNLHLTIANRLHSTFNNQIGSTTKFINHSFNSKIVTKTIASFQTTKITACLSQQQLE